MLSKELLAAIITQLETSLQQKVVTQHIQQVFGGDINQTYVLKTSAGPYFLKVNDDSRVDMFEMEFNGLQLLHGRSALKVPVPVVTGRAEKNIFLVMQFIMKGYPTNNFWQQFGYALAMLHKNTDVSFGLDEDNYIGTIRQQNTTAATWAEFYAQQRIMPLMRSALQQNKCASKDVQAAEKLCNRLADIFPVEPPALLHGDLWGGNFMAGEDGLPVMYDPAVYYGHREMDIAMTMLFGGFDRKLYDYYNEAYPLQPAWQQRVQLCQLYPLLVHLLLFGGHYYNSLMEVIKKYGD